ncbi:hypothetical protein [Kocuria sp. CPCC 205231]|uniref:hypothetical protein n=1 Tax=unclassified Kocuria TaxID=2649579 RepID=UPI0034D4DD15
MTRWTVMAGISTTAPLGPAVLEQLRDALRAERGVVTYCIPGLWLQIEVQSEDDIGACRSALDRLAGAVFALLPTASLTDLQITPLQVPDARPQAA